MPIGCFTDKSYKPTPDDIDAALGIHKRDWLSLVQFVRETLLGHEEWKFMYGKRYGWALHIFAGRQMLTNLYPSERGFTVQVNLSEPEVQKAFQTELSPQVRRSMEAATVYPEGRWMFIPVESERDLVDIQRLLTRRKIMLEA
jgi:hypothetical protein